MSWCPHPTHRHAAAFHLSSAANPYDEEVSVQCCSCVGSPPEALGFIHIPGHFLDSCRAVPCGHRGPGYTPWTAAGTHVQLARKPLHPRGSLLLWASPPRPSQAKPQQAANRRQPADEMTTTPRENRRATFLMQAGPAISDRRRFIYTQAVPCRTSVECWSSQAHIQYA